MGRLPALPTTLRPRSPRPGRGSGHERRGRPWTPGEEHGLGWDVPSDLPKLLFSASKAAPSLRVTIFWPLQDGRALPPKLTAWGDIASTKQPPPVPPVSSALRPVCRVGSYMHSYTGTERDAWRKRERGKGTRKYLKRQGGASLISPLSVKDVASF